MRRSVSSRPCARSLTIKKVAFTFSRLRVSRILPVHHRARTVVKGKIDALFFGKGKRRLRKDGARAQMRRQNKEAPPERPRAERIFSAYPEFGNFYKNIYFFPRVCYNRQEKARKRAQEENNGMISTQDLRQNAGRQRGARVRFYGRQEQGDRTQLRRHHSEYRRARQERQSHGRHPRL